MKTIVFDFFGVICSEIADFVLARYLPPEGVALARSGILRDADLGRISQAEMFEKLAAMAGVPARRLDEEFWALVKIDGEVVNLIEGLRPSCRVALLTNATVPFVREILARYDLERLFHAILVSAEEGLVKPDPAIFTRLLVRMAACPRTTVMIDDNQKNIAGAKAAGMQGLLFESAAQLASDLANAAAR